MTRISRRHFGQAAATGTAILAAPAILRGQGAARVVVVGGGAGGGTVARYLKRDAPELDVSLIEGRRRYTSCFYSNLYIGGMRNFDSITHTYDGLAGLGINVVSAMVTDVDAAARSVTLEDGSTVDYDRLVLAPGIDLQVGCAGGL